MAELSLIEPAFDALDACSGALGVLDANCCDPGRSPRIAELAETLTEARIKLRAVTIAPETAGPAALAVLEEAGAQVGRLQDESWAPELMPMHAEIQENLEKAQLVLGRVLDD